MNSNVIRLRAPADLKPGPTGALPSRLTGTAYSGGKVPSYGCVIDLASTSVPKRMPLLMEHQRQSIIGVIEDSDTAGGTRLTVTGRLFSDIPGGDAAKVAELSMRGAQFQMSVGLFGYTEQIVAAGQQVAVNGQVFAGPLTLLRRGVVRECSIVTLGADPETEARLFSRDARTTASLSPQSILARRVRQAAGFER